MKLSNLFPKWSRTPPERAVYAQIVALARQPFAYLEAGVPDTVTGRFDMITLHIFLILEHLGGKGEIETQFGQLLFDEMFLDMDHSLREMGVGDLSVGKKVRKMSEIFYGATAAYREALKTADDGDTSALGDAFKRNITGKDVSDGQLEKLIDYTMNARALIGRYPVADIVAGNLDLPSLVEGSEQ